MVIHDIGIVIDIYVCILLLLKYAIYNSVSSPQFDCSNV